jgi:hypothetical protein
MHDDHPLWYDHAEPDEAPSRTLLALAGLFGAALHATASAVRLYWAPERLWRWTSGALARRQKIGARRS